MSQDVERVFTVNLGKVLLSPDNQRAKRAINMIKEFARHHMKMEQVKLEEDVSHLIWSKGIKHPPRKIRVRMTRTDEGYILVSKYEGEEEVIEKEEKSALGSILSQFSLKRAYHACDFMAARKRSGRKIRLLKKQKETSPVPAWVILRTNKTVRTNPKRRAWRQTDVEVG